MPLWCFHTGFELPSGRAGYDIEFHLPRCLEGKAASFLYDGIGNRKLEISWSDGAPNRPRPVQTKTDVSLVVQDQIALLSPPSLRQEAFAGAK